MKLIHVNPDLLHTSRELLRSGSAKNFEDRLRSSIEEIGLAEPLKIAAAPSGGYLVIDGALRLRAIQAIRKSDASLHPTIPAYLLEYDRRFEIRFQSDIYQDLLPSQLATLVEHLHESEHIKKSDIARYIGVSPATLRNYTGLWRLLKRGGLFGRIVELMDLGVFPASNPYAWIRLTDEGLVRVLTDQFAKGQDLQQWLSDTVTAARNGSAHRYPIKFIELATSDLPGEYYREDQTLRATKKDLGLRRSTRKGYGKRSQEARNHLERVAAQTDEPVLLKAAEALKERI